jgi:hypothetical protein
MQNNQKRLITNRKRHKKSKLLLSTQNNLTKHNQSNKQQHKATSQQKTKTKMTSKPNQ